jgi:hypothetical protein
MDCYFGIDLNSTLAFLGSDNKQKTTSKCAELIAEFRKISSRLY